MAEDGNRTWVKNMIEKGETTTFFPPARQYDHNTGIALKFSGPFDMQSMGKLCNKHDVYTPVMDGIKGCYILVDGTRTKCSGLKALLADPDLRVKLTDAMSLFAFRDEEREKATRSPA